MFDNKQLKDLSHICAYCGKALKETDKTYDHLIPKSAGGKRYTNNIVICCEKCNNYKANLDIQTFLNQNENRFDNFKNYLDLIDIQRGNKNYSTAVLKKIYGSSYTKNFKSKKSKRLNEVQDIEYNIYGTDINFKLNDMQSKILDYYIENPDYTDYKKLAKILRISRGELRMHIIHINCLTGIFILKNVSQNGIVMNPMFSNYMRIQKL